MIIKYERIIKNLINIIGLTRDKPFTLNKFTFAKTPSIHKFIKTKHKENFYEVLYISIFILFK